jgi:hypothetical protein
MDPIDASHVVVPERVDLISVVDVDETLLA